LISNSLKYAFPDPEDHPVECEIKIDFTKDQNNELILQISDNGVGMPEDFDFNKSQSFGLQLVETLIKQLDGKKETEFTNGTMTKIIFRDVKP